MKWCETKVKSCVFIVEVIFTASLGCSKTVLMDREVFFNRFYNIVTAAALSHKRLRTPGRSILFFFLERKMPAQSKLKEHPWPCKLGLTI